MDLLKKIEGKKTYIVAFILATLNLLVVFNVISPEQVESINYALVALGLGTIRSGIKNNK